jgi:hypothetical protein
MPVDNQEMERKLRQAAAWAEFERKQEGLLARLRAQAGAVAAASPEPRRRSPLPVFPWVAMPIAAQTEAEDPWEETIENRDWTLIKQQASSGDIHLHLRYHGHPAGAPEVVRLVIHSSPEEAPESGAICLRWSEPQQAFVAAANLGRVGRGVGVELQDAFWSEVTEEEAAWALLHAADDPSRQAWLAGWAQYREEIQEEIAEE